MKYGYNIRMAVILALSALASPATPVKAQQKLSDIRVVVRDVRQERDSIRAVLEIEAIGVGVAPRERLRLYPVIRHGMNERGLPPVVISGRAQQAVEKRAERLSGVAGDVYASYGVKGRKLFHERIPYSAMIPIEDWMADADVAMVQERVDCRGEYHRFSVEVIADGIRFIPEPKRPVYEFPFRFPAPPREEIKNRSESGQAQIIYRVGNADINPVLGNNRDELNEIRRSIEDIRRMPGVKINSISIASYASPEGSWQNNRDLSERRAASLVSWLGRNYDLTGVTLASRGLGEDWEGLSELVAKDPAMSGQEKQAVLAIISDTGIFDGRERQLMRYNGGQTYRYMLQNIFPLLRRSAYRIDFTIPEYSIETIREVFDTRPDMLSLYEFYLLADRYEPGSPQFREVIEKAARIYPDDKYIRISMAMLNYYDKNAGAGLEVLRGLEGDPVAWPYFAILHAVSGDLEKAEAYARRAVEAGDADAAGSLGLIERYKADDALYREKLREWEMFGIREK